MSREKRDGVPVLTFDLQNWPIKKTGLKTEIQTMCRFEAKLVVENMTVQLFVTSYISPSKLTHGT